MALRRWKPFLGAFEHIDAAIEAADADGLLSRDEFRSARGRIVELLCDAGDDGEKAEALCALLDEAMAGSLATLRAVPAETITPRVMACGDLVGAIGALATGHGSERVRRLARDVASGWRAGIEARARVAMDLLDGFRSNPPPPAPKDDMAPAVGTETKQKKEAKIPEQQQPHPRKKTATVTVNSRRVCTTESCGPILSKKTAPIVTTSKAKPSANLEAPRAVPAQPKKPPPSVAVSAEEQNKMEATKRKLHERYQEAEDAKRRRTIQVIKPPRPPARRPASCAEQRRRFMKPSSSLRMGV